MFIRHLRPLFFPYWLYPFLPFVFFPPFTILPSCFFTFLPFYFFTFKKGQLDFSLFTFHFSLFTLHSSLNISSIPLRLFSFRGQSGAICPSGMMATASRLGSGNSSRITAGSKLHTQQVPSPRSVAARHRCSVAIATSMSP